MSQQTSLELFELAFLSLTRVLLYRSGFCGKTKVFEHNFVRFGCEGTVCGLSLWSAGRENKLGEFLRHTLGNRILNPSVHDVEMTAIFDHCWF